jgi:hypothetical protein
MTNPATFKHMSGGHAIAIAAHIDGTVSRKPKPGCW